MVFIFSDPSFKTLCARWWNENYIDMDYDELTLIQGLSWLSDTLTDYMFGDDTDTSDEMKDAMDNALKVVVNYIESDNTYGVVNRIGVKDCHGSFFIQCENYKYANIPLC